MDQEIRSAIARASTLPPAADPLDTEFETMFRGPQTLATVAAALAICPHPQRCQVDGRVSRDDQTEEIVWCAACGAMAAGNLSNGVGPQWQRAALVHQLSSEQFEELGNAAARLQAVVADVRRGVAIPAPARADKASELSHVAIRLANSEWDTFTNALRDLATLTLFRELKGAAHAQRLLALREAFESDPVSP